MNAEEENNVERQFGACRKKVAEEVKKLQAVCEKCFGNFNVIILTAKKIQH